MNYVTLSKVNKWHTGEIHPGLGDMMLSVKAKTQNSSFHQETKNYINQSLMQLKLSVGVKTVDPLAL